MIIDINLSNQIKELEALSSGLKSSNTLLLNEKGSLLECQFLKDGMPGKVIQIKCQILAASLREEVVFGILEGSGFISFRNNFSAFSLRVKTKALYLKLSADQRIYAMELPAQAVA